MWLYVQKVPIPWVTYFQYFVINRLIIDGNLCHPFLWSLNLILAFRCSTLRTTIYFFEFNVTYLSNCIYSSYCYLFKFAVLFVSLIKFVVLTEMPADGWWGEPSFGICCSADIWCWREEDETSSSIPGVKSNGRISWVRVSDSYQTCTFLKIWA